MRRCSDPDPQTFVSLTSGEPPVGGPVSGEFEGPILTFIKGPTGGSAERTNPRRISGAILSPTSFHIDATCGLHHLPPQTRHTQIQSKIAFIRGGARSISLQKTLEKSVHFCCIIKHAQRVDP
jgi:hypothetical protein